MKEKSLDYKVEFFTGIRPTSALTVANYLGAIAPLIEVQKKSSSILVFVANLHGMTDEEPQVINQYIREIVVDYLSLGLDPKKAKIYIQSDIADEISFFTLLLSRHISVAELLRVPTLKEKLKQKLKKEVKSEQANTLLLLYPVMMAADILINRAKKVPIGEDQMPHLELTRELARKFNKKYGPTFPLPTAFQLKPIRILSLFGKEKMSKSLPEGAIFLTDDIELVAKKIKRAETAFEGKMTENLESLILIGKNLAKTDEEKKEIDKLIERHLKGEKVMVKFKEVLTKIVQNFLKEFQEKREKLLKKESYISKILKEGKKIAKENAKETLEAVKERLGLN